MSFLVGTLYCGENEFDRCVQSLESQTNSDWEQFVVRNLPNKLAHETLYETFMNRAAEFDFFLKLDADMVLEDPRMLQRIEAYFQQHAYLDGITIRVHDFFSDQLIHGLHVYRSCVQWKRNQERLFVDTPPVSGDQFRIGVRELEPAASHCEDPSPIFAFHFGIHRGLKARHATGGSAACYLQTIERVWQHYCRNPDRRLGLAVLGAEMALVGKFSIEDLDLNNEHLREVCSSYQSLATEAFDSEIQKLRSADRGLPILHRRGRIVSYRLAQLVTSFVRGIWPALVACVPPRIRQWRRARMRPRC